MENYINKIICGDSLELLKQIPNDSIDLVVTSPPYDNIRDYKGFSLDLNQTGAELFRVMKEGSIVAVVIQDQTKDFGKSLTSFKLAID
jgi:site-specific DNA-methyltransferase (adenine-specific)